MNVSGFDLNQVRALHFLLEEAHVARAARRLGITPAAASNALRRLREHFDDPLLIRAGRKLVRTQRAETLRAPASEMMLAGGRLLEAAVPFEPATAEWEASMTTSDRIAELLLPVLDGLVSQRAPRASLSLRTTTVDVAPYLREHGGVAVLPTFAHEPELQAEPLFAESFVCAFRQGHPLKRGPWSVERFAAAEHVLVAPQAASRRALTDELLERRGLQRRVTRIVNSFALALPLIASTNRVAVLPSSYVGRRARELGLATRPVPLALPAIDMTVCWHRSHERDPKHVWLRGLLHETVRTLGLHPKASG